MSSWIEHGNLLRQLIVDGGRQVAQRIEDRNPAVIHVVNVGGHIAISILARNGTLGRVIGLGRNSAERIDRLRDLTDRIEDVRRSEAPSINDRDSTTSKIVLIRGAITEGVVLGVGLVAQGILGKSAYPPKKV